MVKMWRTRENNFKNYKYDALVRMSYYGKNIGQS